MIYAQLDGMNICIAISQLSEPIDRPDMIELPEIDESILGQEWTGAGWTMPSKPV